MYHNFDAESLFQIRLVGLLTTCSEFVVRILRKQHTNNSLVIYCIHYQSTERDMKLEIITSAVLEQLTIMCTECGITSDIIDRPSFACFPESPTSVTYRARLLGTSETDSGSLISDLIEDWVSGGASIIVTGVLMTVDSKCSVAISSLSEGECQPHTTNPTTDRVTPPDSSDPFTDSTPSTTDNTAAIIGGSVVAVVLIITVALTITFLLKNRYGNNTSINKQKE